MCGQLTAFHVAADGFLGRTLSFVLCGRSSGQNSLGSGVRRPTVHGQEMHRLACHRSPCSPKRFCIACRSWVLVCPDLIMAVQSRPLTLPLLIAKGTGSPDYSLTPVPGRTPVSPALFFRMCVVSRIILKRPEEETGRALHFGQLFL